VGATLDGGHEQVAFASVLRANGDLVQQFHTITFEDGVGVDVELESWNEEGVTFDGIEPDALGLDFKEPGLEAYGVFPTSSVVQDLQTGGQSCELTPGDLTDVAIWGPDSALDHDYMHFSAMSNGDAIGFLFGYPEGVCPYSDPPVIRPGALLYPIGSRPLALALSSRSGNPFWLYTANASGSVTALELLAHHDDEDGDSVTIVSYVDLPLDGCPSAIVFRDEQLEVCMQQNYTDPPGPPPRDPDDPQEPTTKYCKLNPDDPSCIVSPKPKP
jgi:hypothetical protein